MQEKESFFYKISILTSSRHGNKKIEALKLHAQLSEQRGVAHLDSIDYLIEREETSMKFRGFQVERDYCEAFQVAINYRVRWAHDFLPIATLPPLEE